VQALLSLTRISDRLAQAFAPGLVLALVLPLAAAEAAESAVAGALSDTAAARLERHRAAREGRLTLPLPGTPDVEKPLTRLAAAGVSLGAPVIIRIFKAESELEVWVGKDGAFVPFATYPICYWSGALGPKLREGDRQSPEGFYTITAGQLHFGDRWRRALDIGYPNVFDQRNGRDGSAILIHGGCDSVGCYAMTEAVKSELFELVSAALQAGQHHVPVAIFPFRMTEDNLVRYGDVRWNAFWRDLKEGYDAFERTHRPPRVTVCERRYHITDAAPGDDPHGEGVTLCATEAAMARAEADAETAVAAATAILWSASPAASQARKRAAERPRLARRAAAPPTCSMARPSCRRWAALRARRMAGLGGPGPALPRRATARPR